MLPFNYLCKKTSMKKIFFFVSILTIVVSCHRKEELKPIKFEGEAQGTYYSITYFDSENRNLQKEIDSLLEAFDLVASVYVENSMVSKINRNEDVEVNKMFIELFNLSKEVSASTDGAFDVTIGPIINAWGFGSTKQDSLPELKLEYLKTICGFNKVRIKNNRVIKDSPEMILNYNAVAQGFSVDIIGRFFDSKGIENYLIDVGGEVLAKGTKPNKELWKVGIEKPSENQLDERKLFSTLQITDKAVATSGNYRKYYIKNGVKISHTIDPSTAKPVNHNLLSVTVVAKTAGVADAYATAFMVMGKDKAIEFIKNHPDKNLSAYFIFSDETGTLKSFATDELAKIVVETN